LVFIVPPDSEKIILCVCVWWLFECVHIVYVWECVRFFKCFFFCVSYNFLFLVGASLVTARTLLRERRTLLRCVLFRIVSEFITRGVDATLFFSPLDSFRSVSLIMNSRWWGPAITRVLARADSPSRRSIVPSRHRLARREPKKKIII
jgi:hypothetical protein